MTNVALSPEQRDIVEHNGGEGAVFVEASAGSGKTRILTERVRYLLTEKKDKFFSVLCLTFTNKAADEMKDRLQGIPKLNERAFIGNFHEFCLNIVKSRYTELGLADPPHLFDENDTKRILEEVLLKNPILKELYTFPEITDLKAKAKKQREKLFQCIDFVSETKRKLKDIPENEINWEMWGEKTTLLYQDYNRRLREQNAMDYDDILLFAYRILLRPAIANIYRRTYQYILIDEAQDLNFAQYNIIKTICGENYKNVLMVGDPKQAIYGFNGASPEYMQKHFVNDFGAERKEIKHNYRSSDSVLEMAEKIQPNGGKGVNYFKGITEVKPFEDEKAEAEWVISQIKAWIEKGFYSEDDKEIVEPITYKNIAVLARNKYVFSSLIELLENDEVLKNKYYLKKGIEKFEPESTLIKLFDLGLRILVNPSDILHFNQIQDLLDIEIPQSSGNKLTDLLTIESMNSEFVSNKELVFVCKYWNHLIQNPKSLGWVIENLKKHTALFEHATDDQKNELEKIAFDLAELEKFWNSFARKESSENQTISNFRYFLALNGSKENREELMLATVHTTKGLEFEIVFLMGMNEGVFPDYRAKTDTAKNEERNNAYVAVTRAKRVLYMTYPLLKKMPWGEDKMQIESSFVKVFKVV